MKMKLKAKAEFLHLFMAIKKGRLLLLLSCVWAHLLLEINTIFMHLICVGAIVKKWFVNLMRSFVFSFEFSKFILVNDLKLNLEFNFSKLTQLGGEIFNGGIVDFRGSKKEVK